MIRGRIDPGRRALIPIELRARLDSVALPIEAWVDTGFTGELVLSQDTIREMDLVLSGKVKGVLADGSRVILPT